MKTLARHWLVIKIWLLQILTDVQSRLLMIIWAVDHLLLAVFTVGRCKPYEMISSAVYDLELRGKIAGRVFRPLIDWVFRPAGPHHCLRSYNWQLHLYTNKP